MLIMVRNLQAAFEVIKAARSCEGDIFHKRLSSYSTPAKISIVGPKVVTLFYDIRVCNNSTIMEQTTVTGFFPVVKSSNSSFCSLPAKRRKV